MEKSGQAGATSSHASGLLICKLIRRKSTSGQFSSWLSVLLLNHVLSPMGMSGTWERQLAKKWCMPGIQQLARSGGWLAGACMALSVG